MGLSALMRPTHCTKCGTALMEAAILYEKIINEDLFQIENVPALVCRECGEEWIDDEVRETLERIITEGVAADQIPN